MNLAGFPSLLLKEWALDSGLSISVLVDGERITTVNTSLHMHREASCGQSMPSGRRRVGTLQKCGAGVSGWAQIMVVTKCQDELVRFPPF